MIKTLSLAALALVPQLDLMPRPDPIAELPPARVAARGGELVIELPPVDLMPAGEVGEMALTPVCRVDIPLSASLYSFRAEIVDAEGQPLSSEFLHHVNLTDPSRRELFLPIGLHLVAASKETPPLAVPRWLFGMPIREGDRYIASAMLANPTREHKHGVRVRLVFRYVEEDSIWPLWDAYPWVMDVMFPLGKPEGGTKAFDLPPGPSERFWEARPAIAGSLVGLGGHVHDYATALELTNVTTGEVIWRGVPERDAEGRVETMPVTRFYRWYRLGIRIDPAHTYRVTVTYQNPTGETIPDGGMGAVAGMFIPDRDAAWPAVDRADPVYQTDLENTLAHRAGPVVMKGHSHSHKP
ncbi:MAG TPA: hypothetical protein VNL18_17060 [Gemmatimonadales bacterium]|nr:hypothetical protein [Gemmatimonadales bacterium]